MAEERNNSGTLGKNPRKEKENHPGYTGKCMIDGKQFWISAWVKEANSGHKFFSLAFKPRESKSIAASSDAPSDAPPHPESDESVPF